MGCKNVQVSTNDVHHREFQNKVVDWIWDIDYKDRLQQPYAINEWLFARGVFIIHKYEIHEMIKVALCDPF